MADKTKKSVNAVALRDIIDTQYDRDDDLYEKGEVIRDMPADQFKGWEEAGLVRAATDADLKAPAKDA